MRCVGSLPQTILSDWRARSRSCLRATPWLRRRGPGHLRGSRWLSCTGDTRLPATQRSRNPSEGEPGAYWAPRRGPAQRPAAPRAHAFADFCRETIAGSFCWPSAHRLRRAPTRTTPGGRGLPVGSRLPGTWAQRPMPSSAVPRGQPSVQSGSAIRSPTRSIAARARTPVRAAGEDFLRLPWASCSGRCSGRSSPAAISADAGMKIVPVGSASSAPAPAAFRFHPAPQRVDGLVGQVGGLAQAEALVVGGHGRWSSCRRMHIAGRTHRRPPATVGNRPCGPVDHRLPGLAQWCPSRADRRGRGRRGQHGMARVRQRWPA